ncbi:MAG: CPBP family intramembrane metalloprotease [Clostridia bacterium]|nr:CPBP family intramembrane metalloprotease [Clostridia bacterium]
MSRRALSFVFFGSLAGAALLSLARALWPFAENSAADLTTEALTTLLCAAAALSLCLRSDQRLWPPKGSRFAFPAPCPTIFAVCTVLCFLVALNNLPLLSLLSGRAQVTAGGGRILLFACVCLSTACFEELFFRAFLFPLLLQRARGARGILLAVLLSAAIFGAAHFFNLAAGASLPATLLQVGYSFLVGCAAALLFLFSRSILLPILFHAVYNFGGLLVERLGEGQIFDTPTVIFTAVLAVVCAVFLVFALFSPALVAAKDQILEKKTKKTPQNADFFEKI